jgi:hypothetical protein
MAGANGRGRVGLTPALGGLAFPARALLLLCGGKPLEHDPREHAARNALALVDVVAPHIGI